MSSVLGNNTSERQWEAPRLGGVLYLLKFERAIQPFHLTKTQRAVCRLPRRWGRTACNKITDAGVGEKHSGSTRMLFQEADRLNSGAKHGAGAAVQTLVHSPVRKVVLVQVQES